MSRSAISPMRREALLELDREIQFSEAKWANARRTAVGASTLNWLAKNGYVRVTSGDIVTMTEKGSAAVSTARREAASKPTYRAYYERDGRTIYRGRPSGNLVGELPVGSFPREKGQCGTLDRTDGGDPYERALFRSSLGTIVVEREPASRGAATRGREEVVKGVDR